MPDVVVRGDVDVLYLRATADEQKAIERAWAELEKVVSLRGRKFFGTYDVGSGEYRACVKREEGDDPAALGLEPGVIPGGRYLRERLQGEPPALYARIAPGFDALAAQADADPRRPSIEHYRRFDEIDLLLPVR